jgi:hypothetical protein
MVKKPWKFGREMPVGHGHAGFFQAVCVFVTFVAQGIGARGQYIGRRKADQRAGARRRCLPIMDVGGAVQIVITKPPDDGMRQQDAGLGCEGCVIAKSIAG